jgi:hypothetical protein
LDYGGDFATLKALIVTLAEQLGGKSLVPLVPLLPISVSRRREIQEKKGESPFGSKSRTLAVSPEGRGRTERRLES